MTQPDFEKVLKAMPGNTWLLLTKVQKQTILNAMKEVWNLAINTCADKSELTQTPSGHYLVDRNSILKHKIK